MRIESLLRRKGGTKVTLDGVEYHFKPDPEGREFADVTNEDHIGVFLSIREGYRLASDKPAKAEAVRTPSMEPPDSPQTAAPPPTIPAISAATTDDLKKLDRQALSDLYQKAYGHRPAPRLREEKIIEAIKASAH